MQVWSKKFAVTVYANRGRVHQMSMFVYTEGVKNSQIPVYVVVSVLRRALHWNLNQNEFKPFCNKPLKFSLRQIRSLVLNGTTRYGNQQNARKHSI